MKAYLTTDAQLCALVEDVGLRRGEWTGVELDDLGPAQVEELEKYIGTGHINVHPMSVDAVTAKIAAAKEPEAPKEPPAPPAPDDTKGGRKRG